MAKNNSTKAKTEPAAEEQQEGITAPVVEDEQVNTTPATEDDQSNITSTPEDEPFAGTHMVNTARGLNLREAPSYGAPVLEILPCGTAVEDIDPEGAPAGWLHVMTEDGKAGFVAARYVDPIKE